MQTDLKTNDNDRLKQLEKTICFNDITAYSSPNGRRNMLVVCNPRSKQPAPIAVQGQNLDIAQVVNTLRNDPQFNVGHALTTQQLDVDFDANADQALVQDAFNFFLPPTPYKFGRKSKFNSHWIFNTLHDLHEVMHHYRHIKDFLETEYQLNGEQVKIELRFRAQTNNDFGAAMPQDNIYILAPGSIHPGSNELLCWHDCFRPEYTARRDPADFIFKRIVLSVITTFIVPYWIEGTRQFMSMALAGALYKFANVRYTHVLGGNSTEDEGLRFTQDDFVTLIEGICHLANDPEDSVRIRTFEQTWRKAEDRDRKITGMTTLRKYIGSDADYIQDSMFRLISGITSETNVQELCERYYLVTGQGLIADTHNMKVSTQWLMTRRNFTDSYDHVNLMWKGKTLTLPNFVYKSGVINVVCGLDYVPPETLSIEYYQQDDRSRDVLVEKDGQVLLNIYQRYAVKPHPDPVTEADVAPFLDYLKAVLGVTPEKMNYLMAFLANLIQNPGQKPRTYLIIVGEQGAGKSFLFEHFITPILGRTNVSVIPDMESVFGGFNSILEGRILAVFEEAINSSRKELGNKIKHFITSPTIQIRRKYVNDYEVGNYTRCVFISNNETTAVTLDVSNRERRAVVLKADPCRIGDFEYWKNLAQWAKNNLGKVHRYLLDYQYKDEVVNTALVTQEKADMQESNLLYQQPAVEWILERLREGSPLSEQENWYDAFHSSKEKELRDAVVKIDTSIWPDLVNVTALRDDFKAFLRSKGLKSAGYNKHLRDILGEMECTRRIQVLVVKDGRSTTKFLRLMRFPSKDELITTLRKKYGLMLASYLDELEKQLEVEDMTMETASV